MDSAALERSLLSHGAAETWAPLFARLEARQPIVLGVFGASVAQNGGCLDQPYKRCMRYDGVHRTFMRWGTPHVRPFKGFAVRLLEHINRTWPHRAHQINNSALDATPAQNALPCLFSHLPTTLHVVVLEFGSMAFHLRLAAVEGAARMLLSLRPPPVLVFLSIHEWCQRLKGAPRALYVPGERLRGGFVYPDTPWARAEAETRRVCEKYGQVCVSMHAALDPLVRAGREGFSLADVVGDDCLHPTHGRHGAQYVAQVLAHAVDRAAERWRSAPRRAAPRAAELPPPLHADNLNVGSRSARCYGFVLAADYRNPYGQSSMYRALQPIAWESAACAAPGVWRLPPAAGGGGGNGKRRAGRRGHAARARAEGERLWTRGAAGETPCHAPAEMATCPRGGFARSEAQLHRFLRHPPRTWFWCYYSLAVDPAHQKKSPGVVALVPGATLHARLDTRMRSLDGAGQACTCLPAEWARACACCSLLSQLSRAPAQDLTEVVEASIEHLTSYEGMGRVAVHCVGDCSCAPQTIDAHRVDAHRNVSVFLQHTFNISGGSPTCGVQLQVLNATSSGGYKFKVRTITLTTR